MLLSQASSLTNKNPVTAKQARYENCKSMLPRSPKPSSMSGTMSMSPPFIKLSTCHRNTTSSSSAPLPSPLPVPVPLPRATSFPSTPDDASLTLCCPRPGMAGDLPFPLPFIAGFGAAEAEPAAALSAFNILVASTSTVRPISCVRVVDKGGFTRGRVFCGKRIDSHRHATRAKPTLPTC